MADFDIKPNEKISMTKIIVIILERNIHPIYHPGRGIDEFIF